MENIAEDYSAEDEGRVISLLDFWGRAGAERISDDIVTAFSLPDLSGMKYQSRQEDSPGSDDGAGNAKRSTSETGHSRSLQKKLDEIDAWSRGQVLPQYLAPFFRKVVRDALVSRIDWYDLVIKEPSSAILSRAVPDSSRGV